MAPQPLLALAALQRLQGDTDSIAPTSTESNSILMPQNLEQ